MSHIVHNIINIFGVWLLTHANLILYAALSIIIARLHNISYIMLHYALFIRFKGAIKKK